MLNKGAILFDLDQTLLNRHESLIRFCQWQAKQYFCLDDDLAILFVQRFISLDANGSVWKDQVYAQLIEEFNLKHTVDTLLQIYLSAFQKFCVPFAHVVECIRRLHTQHYRIALVSNGRTPFQQANFQSLGLSEYFQSIIVSEAVGLRKPDPAIFKLACKQLGCLAENSIFIGDNEQADIVGAKNAGLQAIRFYPPNKQTTDHIGTSPSQADAGFDDYTQLADLIARLQYNSKSLNQ